MNGKKARMTLFFPLNTMSKLFCSCPNSDSPTDTDPPPLLPPPPGRGTQKLMPHMPGYARSNAAY